MKTAEDKLTLKLKRSTIVRAKAYAQDQGTSLSRLVERFFDALDQASGDAPAPRISPRVRALSGVISLPKRYDVRKEYVQHVLRKHGKR